VFIVQYAKGESKAVILTATQNINNTFSRRVVRSLHFFRCHICLMCVGPCIVVINEEEEPTRCYLVFYYTYDRLNMFRAALCPSSGDHDYISDYHTDCLILRLLMAGG
jgi:chorismate mutase